MNDASDVLIDAARDVLESVLRRTSEDPPDVIGRWLASTAPLVRRVGVHGMRKASSVPPDDKLAWLLQNDLLFDIGMKHEVFMLLRENLPAASSAARRSILSRARRGILKKDEPKLDPRTRDYERYNLLYWIWQSIPDDAHASAAFKNEQERHPEFGPRDDPDMEISEPRAAIVPTPKVSDDLATRKPDTDTVRWLVDQLDAEDDFWPDASHPGAAIASAARSQRDWGLRLAQTMKRERVTSPRLWSALISAWVEPEMSDQDWRTAFLAMSDAAKEPLLAHEISRLLGVYAQALKSPTLPSLVPAQRVADAVWTAAADLDSGLQGPDWLTWAINHPGGKLAEFWVRLVALYQGDDTQKHFPRPAEIRLRRMISSQKRVGEAAKVFLASQLHFLHYVDERWTTRWLLPLFSWAKPTEAERVWDGFLIWGRLNESVIEMMLPLYKEAFSHLAGRPREWRDHFARHLAIISVRTSRHPLDDGWLVRFVTDAPADDRASWANHVTFQLRDLDEAARDLQWNKWLGRYWSNRVSGVPRRLSKAELTQMLIWAAIVREGFDEAVALAEAGPAGPADSIAYHFLSDGDLADAQPHRLASFLGRLLRDEPGPQFYDCHEVTGIVHRLRAAGLDDGDLADVRLHALRLGCGSV